MNDQELKKLKSIAVSDLRDIFTQASYGNIYQHQLENFVDSIVNIIKKSLEKEGENNK